MPEFSLRSKAKLSQCDQRLQELFAEVIKHHDCTILEGRRSKERQDELYRTGKSKVQYPNSKHNTEPYSMACDVAPYPIDWEDRKRWYFFGGFVTAMAKTMGVPIRWGGDWDSDMDLGDQTFFDLPHFEIRE